MRNRIVGIDKAVPLLDGSLAPYVYLDNASSTPAFTDVMAAVEEIMPYYSSIHRGTGFKSRLCTHAYDKAHETVAEFVGVSMDTNTVIFTKNATESLNKLACRMGFCGDDIVLVTRMEHHSNDLPWRKHARVVHVEPTSEGSLDLDDFRSRIDRYGDRIKLVAVTGASNVTGFIQPLDELARITHSVGAMIAVDGAQLGPHRKIDMKPDDTPEHIDFMILSAHKMYAPFGTGALIGPKAVFLRSGPEYVGGGTVSVVTDDEASWCGLPNRDEAGSPNVVGAIAMAAAARVLMNEGMDRIAAHEEQLIAYALDRLGSIPKVRVFGVTDPSEASRKVGVIPFDVEGIPHGLVAAIAGYEGGIGVRNGMFCAQPYMVRLLGMNEEQIKDYRSRILSGDRSCSPGLVRMSFGCYNTTGDMDRLVEMLKNIIAGDYNGVYVQDSSGQYIPEGYDKSLGGFLSI